ncbi:myeloid differentiation primary response [Nesidiocoris tenuis]|uniref:Myeloid differentiation primary response n=1 Tax=Nesidiocoris tenuis TaxID=355587 RepID=A0ABN7AVV7_9HEMI|nr:myeloid differentiation primary response [Nesidiocoris tenuis]
MDEIFAASGDVPLSALRNKTRDLISNLLNPCKVLPSHSGYPRDYRGLAYLLDIPLPACKCPDPTASVLLSWEKAKNPSVADFLGALEEIDRFDVKDDIKELVEADQLEYNQRKADPDCKNAVLDLESDAHILTVDDVQRLEKGLQPQNYDAFLLYSDDDAEFANEMVNRLETQYQLKLCLKDRDLVGGVTFEHEAIMRLISERCKRLIILVSPSFLQSPANKFFVTFAQALGIEQRQRKIVPCIYKRVALPQELSYYFVLDYTRTSPLWNFWDRLSSSVKAPALAIGPSTSSADRSRNRAIQSSVKITEVTDSEVQLDPAQWVCPDKTPELDRKERLRINSASGGPLAQKEPEMFDGKKKEKKKSKMTVLLSGLLPSPPTEAPNGKRWFKRKKDKVRAASE